MKKTILKIATVAIIISILFFNLLGRTPYNKTQSMQEIMPDFHVVNVEKTDENHFLCEIDLPSDSNYPFEAENLTSDTFFPEVNIEDAILLAKAAQGEYRGSNDEEVLAVYWCIFNRVDAVGYGMGNNIEYVLTFPYQFLGYNENNSVDDRLIDLAFDALTAWETEKLTGELSGERVIPPEYLWFSGNSDCTHNTYRNTFEFTSSTDYISWNNGEKITKIN